jgi:hypothetical protein
MRVLICAAFALYDTEAQARSGIASNLDLGIVGLVFIVIAVCVTVSVAEKYVRKWLRRTYVRKPKPQDHP